MAILPVRELGKVGVVPDSNPYNLPLNGFSDANNVIFREGNITRAPIFKQVYSTIKSTKSWADFGSTTWDGSGTVSYESAEGSSTSNSRFVASYADASNGESVLVADNDGTVRAYPGGSLQVITPSVTLITNEEPWAHCQVSGVSILSRTGMVPYARNLLSDSTYKSLGTSNWGTTTTCSVIRSYNDFAVALNINKSGTAYPTMVKWCDPVQYGSAVSALDWNAASTTNSAGENVIGEMTSPIIDGQKLGTQFIIYSKDQVWIMEYTGSSLVFNFRKLFQTGGVINVNCVAEAEGKHFVFGVDDIYMHDGMSKKSIADNRVRRHIFRNMDLNKAKKFYVVHDPVGSFVYFCYYTKQNEVGFPGTAFCNRAAIYNYREDNWSFMDLPNTVGGCQARLSTSDGIYPNASGTYEMYNTAYLSFDSNYPQLPVMVGVTDATNGLTESRAYAMDLPMLGVVNLPVTMETVRPCVIARSGIDLDEVQAGVRGYKFINSVVPQSEFESTSGSMLWQLGAADLPSAQITYQNTYDFDPNNDYIINCRAYGRYLAYKVTVTDVNNFKLSGFDVDVRGFNRR